MSATNALGLSLFFSLASESSRTCFSRISLNSVSVTSLTSLSLVLAGFRFLNRRGKKIRRIFLGSNGE